MRWKAELAVWLRERKPVVKEKGREAWSRWHQSFVDYIKTLRFQSVPTVQDSFFN